MEKFEQLWKILIKFGPFWTNLDKFEQIWTSLNKFGQGDIQKNSEEKSEIFWKNQKYSEKIKNIFLENQKYSEKTLKYSDKFLNTLNSEIFRKILK